MALLVAWRARDKEENGSVCGSRCHSCTEAAATKKATAGVAQKQKAEVEKVVKAEIDKVAEAQKEVVESEFHYSITYGGILFVLLSIPGSLRR